MQYVKEKIVISGGTHVEHTFYERFPQAVSGSFHVSKRVRNPFARRRSDNLRASKRAFVRYVLSGIKTFGPPLLLTFTYRYDIGNPRDGYPDLRAFILRLRKDGYDPKGIFVPEFQKSGRLHYHALMWGLPLSFGTGRGAQGEFIQGSERSTRYLALRWGQGFLDCIKTDGSEKLTSYLAKYFTKAYGDDRLIGVRLFYRTRNIPKPFVYSGAHISALVDVPKESDILSQYVYHSRFHGKIKKITYERKISSSRISKT